MHDQQRKIAKQLRQARLSIGEHDLVTSLPSRQQFIADLPDSDALAGAGALVLVTLATAQHYNVLLRVLGHDAADHFVMEYAERLMSGLPGECGKLYHVSVMSFVFCLPPGHPEKPETVAENIANLLEEPVHFDGIPIDATVGIGLLDTSRRNFEPAGTLRAAMTAAQAARQQEETCWRWYDRGTDEAFKRSFVLLTDLRIALTEKPEQLSLHFQPRIDLSTKRCTSVEALLRWNHPTLGAVSPGEFIPLAEATALITPLTAYVMDQSIETLERWQADGLDLTLSANMSPCNLDEAHFTGDLLRRLDKRSIDHGSFELEFTEGVMTANTVQHMARMNRLIDAGVDIAIDDFGSGYSNLSYIAELPASTLKIDQSFIRPMDGCTDKQRLVRSIIELAKSFDYRVVGEGIETARSLDQLTDWGCDEGQGYYIARPMPEADLRDWLATQEAR